MDLLIPEIGTVIWMLLAAGIVFFILVKWGFPVITGMVEKRNDFIDKSLESAKQANAKLAGIQVECEKILEETKAEKARILKDATERRDEIIAVAETAAKESGEKIIAQAREQIQLEKEEVLRSIRSQVAELTVEIAEKVIRKELDGKENQLQMIDRLIDEIDKNSRI